MPKRSSLRLKGYDYSSAGYYFLTICVNYRMHLFGQIINERMILNDSGQMVQSVWDQLPKHYPIYMDTFVVMPNHIHGIIEIRRVLIHQTQDIHKGMINHAPTESWRLMQQHDVSLGKIIRHFKAKTTKLIHAKNSTFAWQRNYYEHIIRHEKELMQIRQYIINNPQMWETDPNNVNP